jgi:hypothetical protein
MPYKDPQQKQEWERLNRPARLARRRELRRIAAAREEAGRASLQAHPGGSFLWPVLAAGVALTLYRPPLGLAAGTVTLIVAALTKKSWHWWAVGVAMLVVALLLLQGEQWGRDADTSPDM